MKSKVYSSNNYTIQEVYFDSLLQFLNFIDKTKPITSKKDSRTGDYSFTKTKSYEEAFEMCKNGYFDKEVEQFQKNFKKITTQVEKKLTPSKVKLDLLGFVPDVPQYLTGNPMNMINVENAPHGRKPKTIILNFNCVASAYVSSSTLQKRGLASLILYQILQELKFNTVFNLTEISECNDFIVNLNIDIMKTGEKVNISRIYFPLVHPSFLRRLTFAFDERNEFLKNRQEYFFGYGRPASIREFNEIANKVDNENKVSLNSDDFDFENYDLKELVLKMIEALGEKGIFENNTEKVLKIVEEIDFSCVESVYGGKGNDDGYDFYL